MLTVAVNREIIEILLMDDDLNQLIVSLNEQYAGHLRIYGVLSRLPEIVHQGVFDVPMEMQPAERIASIISKFFHL